MTRIQKIDKIKKYLEFNGANAELIDSWIAILPLLDDVRLDKCLDLLSVESKSVAEVLNS
jgi:hypothetical protein